MLILLTCQDPAEVVKEQWFVQVVVKRPKDAKASGTTEPEVTAVVGLGVHRTSGWTELDAKVDPRWKTVRAYRLSYLQGNVERQAADIMEGIARNLDPSSANSRVEVWVLVEDCPTVLYEALMHALRTSWPQWHPRPFSPSDGEQEVSDSFVHYDPTQVVDPSHDIYFRWDLFDSEEQEHIKDAVDNPRSVLIIGPRGCGKTLLARYIHYHTSATARGKFVPVNLTAVGKELVEGELRGVRRGGYTGAVERKGLLGAANNGTLFLDEIAEATEETQKKLLDLVSERIGLVTYRKVGSDDELQTKVRFIAATNLPEHDWKGKFREDLRSRFLLTINLKALTDKQPGYDNSDSFAFFQRAVSHFTEIEFRGSPWPVPQWDVGSLRKAYNLGLLPNNLRDLMSMVFRLWARRRHREHGPYSDVTLDDIKAYMPPRQSTEVIATCATDLTKASVDTVRMVLSQCRGIPVLPGLLDLSEKEVKELIYGLRRLTLDIATAHAGTNDAKARRLFGVPGREAFAKLRQNPERLHPDAHRRTSGQ